MEIIYTSDVHNDYHGNNGLILLGNEIPADLKARSVLVVAGDINSRGRTVADLEDVADDWLAVVAVPGNHDWWGLALHERHKFETTKANVHILLEDYVIINDVVFCGTTLWHQVPDQLTGRLWKDVMNDESRIRGNDYKRLQGWDIHVEHLKAVAFIEDCQRLFRNKTKVLITHHALNNNSLNPIYSGHNSNVFYSTHRPDLLDGFKYHIHGHIHCESDYMVGDCNVVCNPRSYSVRENSNYGLRILEC